MIDFNPLVDSITIVVWVFLIIIPTAKIYEEFRSVPIAGVFSIFWVSLITFMPHSPFAFIVDGAVNGITSSLVWAVDGIVNVLISNQVWIAVVAVVILVVMGVAFNSRGIAPSISHYETSDRRVKQSVPNVLSCNLNNTENGPLLSDKINNDSDQFNEIVEKILQFRYNQNRRRKFSDNHELEEDYHNQLHQWLKSVYPNAINDTNQRGSSRPDIVIDDICIEIKGPTRKNDVRDIGQKLFRYRNHYDPRIIVVFFYPEINLESQYFCEFITGVNRDLPEVVIIAENPDGVLEIVC
ncbi:hypothetical protein [Methanogenium cariaci]|jgi:hypothetical protein